MNPTPIKPKATYQGGEALPMVGTAEYNQSLNLANQAGAGNLSSPTPSGFSISIPETIPSSSMASSNSTGDLFNYRSLIESQQNSYNDYLNSISELNQSLGQFMQPSETEQDLTGQLNALNQSERQGLLDTENKVIPMSFITGQQASIQRQAGIDRQALSEQLGTVQSQRQAGLEAINQQIQIAQSQYNAGVDMNNNLMKIQQLMDEKSKMETQVVQLDNGSTILVNTQTGEVIKNLGGIKPATGGIGDMELTTAQTTAINQVDTVLSSLDSYKTLYETLANKKGGKLFGEDASRLAAAYNTLMFQIAQAAGTGALQAADREIVEAMIPNPTRISSSVRQSFRGGREGGVKAIDEARSLFENKKTSILSNPYSTSNLSGTSETTKTQTIIAPDGTEIEIID